LPEIPKENRQSFFSAREEKAAGNPVNGSRRRKFASTILAGSLPTGHGDAVRAAAVGSFPFDPARAASHNVTIAVLRARCPEPRGNAVRAVLDRASPELPPQL